MQYTRKEQEKFLDEELFAISDKYIKLIRKQATVLLKEGEVFVSQFIKTDETGCAILKMRNSKGLPRKGDYFCATLLVGEMAMFKNWGNISWAELRKRFQKDFSEVCCVWLGKTNDPDFSFVGIKGVSIELSKELKPNCILVLGPKEPPIAYFQNLINILRDEPEDSVTGKMLDSELEIQQWNPIELSGAQSTGDFFRGQLALSDEIIIQGPPGTGKTYKMADLISGLPDDSKILVTALTNRALMELAGKESIREKLAKGQVYKTRLTADESKELPELHNIEGRDLHCEPGHLTLATFYAASHWAKSSEISQPYDYVIMDEASQGLFVMLCAVKKLGKKIIWIGDQCQMSPVVNMNSDKIIDKNWLPLSSGFKTLCESFSYPSYLLCETYRLNKRTCEFTGVFYKSALKSISNNQDLLVPGLPSGGGPVFVPLELELGNRHPNNMIYAVLEIIHMFYSMNDKIQIAILSKFKDTVKHLQKAFITHFGEKNNVIIDTVERVQGLTCDVCIFCIPNDLQYMSVEKTLFNVATSRSRCYTIIIADNSIYNITSIDVLVKQYLEMLEHVQIQFTPPFFDKNI